MNPCPHLKGLHLIQTARSLRSTSYYTIRDSECHLTVGSTNMCSSRGEGTQDYLNTLLMYAYTRWVPLLRYRKILRYAQVYIPPSSPIPFDIARSIDGLESWHSRGASLEAHSCPEGVLRGVLHFCTPRQGYVWDCRGGDLKSQCAERSSVRYRPWTWRVRLFNTATDRADGLKQGQTHTVTATTPHEPTYLGAKECTTRLYSTSRGS